MRYCVVYLVKGELQEYFNQITTDVALKFGTKDLSKRVPPHITLKYPFETDDIREVENKIIATIKGKPNFNFIVEGFERFADKKETIFLSVKVDEAAYSVLKQVISEIGEIGEDRNFPVYKPHLSVVRHLDDGLSDKISEYLNTLPKSRFELFFNNVAILAFENDVWRVYKEFSFK